MRDRDTGGELATRQRDGLRVVPVADSFARRWQGGQTHAGTRTRHREDLVAVEERVLLLGDEIGHGVTGGYRRQEPEGMIQVRQQAHIGVRERGLLSPEFEIVDLGGRIGAADDVEPLLYAILVLELRCRTDTARSEELVEVELVELPLGGNRQQ